MVDESSPRSEAKPPLLDLPSSDATGGFVDGARHALHGVAGAGRVGAGLPAVRRGRPLSRDLWPSGERPGAPSDHVGAGSVAALPRVAAGAQGDADRLGVAFSGGVLDLLEAVRRAFGAASRAARCAVSFRVACLVPYLHASRAPFWAGLVARLFGGERVAVDLVSRGGARPAVGRPVRPARCGLASRHFGGADAGQPRAGHQGCVGPALQDHVEARHEPLEPQPLRLTNRPQHRCRVGMPGAVLLRPGAAVPLPASPASRPAFGLRGCVGDLLRGDPESRGVGTGGSPHTGLPRLRAPYGGLASADSVPCDRPFSPWRWSRSPRSCRAGSMS